MKRRHFLLAGAALVGLGPLRAARAQTAVDPATRLIIADQSERVRNLLEASGERAGLGFQLEFPNFAGGPAILEAIRAGALDAAMVGDVPPIQARASGTLLPIVATFTRRVAEYRLVARSGTGVETLADLRGKRLSYVEGSGRQAFLIEALNRAGIGLDEVELVALRVADLNDALRSQAIDVAVLLEPHVTRLANQGIAAPIQDPEERNLLPSTSYFYARPAVLDDPQKTAALAEFLAAFVRASAWENTHRDAWGQHYFFNFNRISPEDTQAILAAQSPVEFQTSAEAIPHHQALVDILHQAGTLPEWFDAAGSFTDAFDAVIAAAR